jgi:hypothetical protein
MATLIKTDGSVVEDYDVSSLEKLQEAVGGYIEIVTLDREMCLIVNEEGLLMGLDQNVWASMVASRLIVGDVIYMKRNEIR